MAAPRPIRWVLTAKDQTGRAFASLNQRIAKAGNKLRGLGKIGLGGIFGAAAGGLGAKNLIDLGESLEDLAATFNSSASEVDGLRQAFEEAGVPAERIEMLLSNLAANASEARQGNVELAAAFRQFGVDPGQLNGVRQLIDLIDGVGRAGKNVRFDILEKLIGGARPIGALKRVASEQLAGGAGVGGFIAQRGSQGMLFSNRQAKELDQATSDFAEAGTRIRNFFGAFIDRALPILRAPARLINTGGDMRGVERQTRRELLEKKFAADQAKYLKEIAENTRASTTQLGP